MKTKFPSSPAQIDGLGLRSRAPAPRPFPPHPTHGEIADRARSIWAARGRPFGCDNEIWLQAEHELMRPLPAAAQPAGPKMTLDRGGTVAGPVETSLDLVASPPERRSPTSL